MDAQDLFTPYRLRVVRVGVHATYLALAVLAAYPLVTPGQVQHPVVYGATVAVALVAVLVVRALPWERLLREGGGIAALYAWSLGDIVLITVLVAVTGGGDSPLWATYALTTVFFAASYPQAGQGLLMLFTAGAYVAGVTLETAGTAPAGAITFRVAALALTAYMASFLARELMDQMVEHHAERLRSERRAELLGAVTSAARQLQTLDLEEVSGVVQSALDDLPTTAVTVEEAEALELLGSLADRAANLARLYQVEQQTIERLERLDELKRDFVSNVSHELRTPLTVLQGVAELLSERWRDLKPEDRDLLSGRLLGQVLSLRRTIDALLDFSRLDAGGLRANVGPVDVAALAREVVDRLGPVLADLDVHVEAPAEVFALADGPLIERVLENLLSNAAAHTPADTEVRITVWLDGDQARVAVRDAGPGIAAHELDQVTERFFRGGEATTRRTRGLGLGLALVDEIVRLHGSELEVDSEPGQGTCFAFRLPAASSVDRVPTPLTV